MVSRPPVRITSEGRHYFSSWAICLSPNHVPSAWSKTAFQLTQQKLAEQGEGQRKMNLAGGSTGTQRKQRISHHQSWLQAAPSFTAFFLRKFSTRAANLFGHSKAQSRHKWVDKSFSAHTKLLLLIQNCMLQILYSMNIYSLQKMASKPLKMKIGIRA